MTDFKRRLLEGAYGMDFSQLVVEWSDRPESLRQIAQLWTEAVEDAYPRKGVRYNAMDAQRILQREVRGRRAA